MTSVIFEVPFFIMKDKNLYRIIVERSLVINNLYSWFKILMTINIFFNGALFFVFTFNQIIVVVVIIIVIFEVIATFIAITFVVPFIVLVTVAVPSLYYTPSLTPYHHASSILKNIDQTSKAKERFVEVIRWLK